MLPIRPKHTHTHTHTSLPTYTQHTHKQVHAPRSLGKVEPREASVSRLHGGDGCVTVCRHVNLWDINQTQTHTHISSHIHNTHINRFTHRAASVKLSPERRVCRASMAVIAAWLCAGMSISGITSMWRSLAYLRMSLRQNQGGGDGKLGKSRRRGW